MTSPPASRSSAGDGRRPVTMKEIAQIAGVSQTTVSRIMNGVEGSVRIAPETRDRVLQAARNLGYRPNPFARGLRGARTGILGLVVREAFDPFFSEVTSLLTLEARKRGYSLVIGAAQSRAEDAAALTGVLDARHCDGILLLGDLLDQPVLLNEISGYGRPMMALCVGERATGMPTINTDNLLGAELALEHLWDLGHRSIAIVHAWVGDHGERHAGYLRFMRERNQAVPREHVRRAEHDAAGGYQAGLTLLRGAERPTAIWATNDMLALGVVKAAYDAGVRVPDDVSVIGFDDMPIAAYAVPALTTIRQPAADIASHAIEGLLSKVADPEAELPSRLVLPPCAVIRQSTTHPPAA